MGFWSFFMLMPGRRPAYKISGKQYREKKSKSHMLLFLKHELPRYLEGIPLKM
jgi:hypothetical protein